MKEKSYRYTEIRTWIITTILIYIILVLVLGDWWQNIPWYIRPTIIIAIFSMVVSTIIVYAFARTKITVNSNGIKKTLLNTSVFISWKEVKKMRRYLAFYGIWARYYRYEIIGKENKITFPHTEDTIRLVNTVRKK